MNKLILAKMREGDWGEVVRLMRKDRQIEDFAAGKVKVIANVSMLTEVGEAVKSRLAVSRNG